MPVGSFPAQFEHISDIHNAAYCTLAQLKENRARLDPDYDDKKERLLRRGTAVLLGQLSQELKLNPWVAEDALVFCGRFFSCRSYARNDRKLFAAAAIFLAAKLRDCNRPAKHVAIAFFKISNVNKQAELDALNRNPDKKVAECGLIEALADAERALLYTLNYNVRDYYVQSSLNDYLAACNIYVLANPPKSPGPVLNDFSMETQKLLTRVANSFCKDIFKTQLYLQFPPEQAAAACTRLAAEQARVQFTAPSDEMLSANIKLGLQFKLSDSDYESFKAQLLSLFQPAAEAQPAAGPSKQQQAADGPAPAAQESRQQQEAAGGPAAASAPAPKPAPPPAPAPAPAPAPSKPLYSRPPPAPAVHRPPPMPRTQAAVPDDRLQADVGSPSDPRSANENNNNNTTPACDDGMAETASTQHAASLEPGELPESPRTVQQPTQPATEGQRPSATCTGTQSRPASGIPDAAGPKPGDSDGVVGPLNGYIQPQHAQQHASRKRRAEDDAAGTCSDDATQREPKAVKVA